MLYYPAIIIFYLLFICLAWKNIRWGVYAVVALLPTYLIRYSVFGLPATLLEGMIWLLFIIWLVKLKQERNLTFNPVKIFKNIVKSPMPAEQDANPLPNQLKLPLFLFLIAATFSVFISANQIAAAGIWKAYFIEPLLFFMIFLYTIKNQIQLKKVIRFLGLTVLAIGAFAVVQKLTGVLIPNPFWADEATRRVTTFFGYPNANALLVVPVVLLTLSNLLTDKKKAIQIFNLAVLVLGALTVFLAKSTGGLIGLLAGFVFILLFHKKTRLATLLVILAVSLGLNFSLPVKKKIGYTLAKASETHLPLDASDFHIRAQQWRETTAMLLDTPVFGAGLAGYQNLVAPYHQNPHVEIYLYPHNFFLNFWTETGFLGLISIIWILIVFFILAAKNPNILTLTAASAMIGLLVHGLVDVPYFKNDLSVLFWIIIGLMIIPTNQWRGARVAESGVLEKR